MVSGECGVQGVVIVFEGAGVVGGECVGNGV